MRRSTEHFRIRGNKMRKHLGKTVAVSMLAIFTMCAADASAQRDRGRSQPSDQGSRQEVKDRQDRGERNVQKSQPAEQNRDRAQRPVRNEQPQQQDRGRRPVSQPQSTPAQQNFPQQDRGRRPVAQPQQVQTQQTFPQQNRRPIVDQPAQVNQSPRQQGNGRINNGETQRINDRRQQQGTWGTSQNTNDRSVGDQRNNNGRYQQIDRRQQEQLQQQRVNQYNQQWKNSQTIEKQRYRQLQEQRRNAYLRYQQRYWERLRRDQIRLQQARYYDNYYNNYRYNRGGNSYYTSQYGAQMLRDAVNNGYEEGFYAGQADRQDGWRSDYNNSYGYQDAAYGYDSYYVSMEEYNYYFREGFRRGYEDGYYSRNRYGNYSNGKYTILGAVIGAIIDIIAD